jgi:hypothetical protein
MNTSDCNKKCESCLMPFTKDTFGVRENEKYCSLCFRDGKFSYEGDLKTFQEMCYRNMVKNGTPKLLARFYTWSIRYAPRWKNNN